MEETAPPPPRRALSWHLATRPLVLAFSLLLRVGSWLLIPKWVVFSSRAVQHIFFLTHCSTRHLSTAPHCFVCTHETGPQPSLAGSAVLHDLGWWWQGSCSQSPTGTGQKVKVR